MIIDTYQSGAVMRILQSGKIYRASPSISFKKEYAALIDMLDLRRPIYRQTAAFGHFGRTDIDLPWERIDRVEQLRAEAAKL